MALPLGDFCIARTKSMTGGSTSRADGADDARPLLEKGQHRFGPAAQLAEDARRLEVGLHLFPGENGQRLVDAFLEDVGDRREAAVDLVPVGLHLRVHHRPACGRPATGRTPVIIALSLVPRQCSTLSGEGRVDGVVERRADVGVVGDRPHHRHAAGILRVDAAP